MKKPRRSNSISEGRSRSTQTTTVPPRAGDGEPFAGPETDLLLVNRLVTGESNAWREFVTTYQQLAFSRIRRTLSQFGRASDHALADDLCADVFATLLANDFAQLRRFEGRSRLSTWLDVVVRRISIRKISQLQAAKKRHTTAEHLETVVGSTGPDSIVDGDRRRVTVAMQRLSEADQNVLRLFYFEQQSYVQIADSLDLSVNSVGPKLKRAQQRLKKILERPKGQPNDR